MLGILEATQAAYGYLPVAALKRISFGTGAWYAMVYGTATFFDHLRFEPPAADERRRRPDRPDRPPELGGRLPCRPRPGDRRGAREGDPRQGALSR